MTKAKITQQGNKVYNPDPLTVSLAVTNVFLRLPLIKKSKPNSILTLKKGAKHRGATSHLDSQYYCIMARKACQ